MQKLTKLLNLATKKKPILAAIYYIRKTDFYCSLPSVNFHRFSRKEGDWTNFDKTHHIAASMLTSSAAAIFYKLVVASRFRQNQTTPTATTFFSSKDADWSVHILMTQMNPVGGFQDGPA